MPPQEIWVNETTITDHYNIELPAKILAVCNVLRANTNNNEFSILCKGEWVKNVYMVSDDYTIPLQRVDHTNVYYDEENLHEIRSRGYNTVIHCHPFKSDWFSRSDTTTINVNFDCSILYSEGAFTTACVSHHITPEFILQSKPKQININWSKVADLDTQVILSNISYINIDRSSCQTKLCDNDMVNYMNYMGDIVTIPIDQLPDNVVYDAANDVYMIDLMSDG